MWGNCFYLFILIELCRRKEREKRAGIQGDCQDRIFQVAEYFPESESISQEYLNVLNHFFGFFGEPLGKLLQVMSLSMKVNGVEIPMLEGSSNYALWRGMLVPIMEQEGAQVLIERDAKKVTFVLQLANSEALKATSEEYQAKLDHDGAWTYSYEVSDVMAQPVVQQQAHYRSMERKWKATLTLTMVQEVKEATAACGTVQEIMAFVKTEYGEKNNKFRARALKRALYHGLRDQETIHEYIQRTEQTRRKLQAMGDNVDDAAIIYVCQPGGCSRDFGWI